MSTIIDRSALSAEESSNGQAGSRIVHFDATARRKEKMRLQAAAEPKTTQPEATAVAPPTAPTQPVAQAPTTTAAPKSNGAFAHPAAAQSDEVRAERLVNPYVHISISDGGAHTRFLVNSVWPVYFLAHWVRDQCLMTLEQAHQKMSALPAWFSDMKNRGTLRIGDFADIMIYNMEELGLLYDKPRFETDFPGGEKRLVQKPTGMRYIVVNGTVTFVENECTNALPGKLLRSYDMVG